MEETLGGHQKFLQARNIPLLLLNWVCCIHCQGKWLRKSLLLLWGLVERVRSNSFDLDHSCEKIYSLGLCLILNQPSRNLACARKQLKIRDSFVQKNDWQKCGGVSKSFFEGHVVINISKTRKHLKKKN